MNREIYKFVTLIECPAGRQEFYTASWLPLSNDNVYFFKSNTRSAYPDSLITLEVIETVNNLSKFYRYKNVHNGRKFIEVNKEFVKHASEKDVEKVMADLVASRLQGTNITWWNS